MRSLLYVALLAGTASAQVSPQQKAAADALFDAGKQLMQSGDVAHACPKFEASLKLVPQLGTHLNLANCYAKEGRTASAWAEFRAAQAEAAKEHDDQRADYAKQQVAQLEPKLDKIAIAAPDDAHVAVDGLAIDPASYGVPFPVDPGDHAVTADRPAGWTKTVTVSGAGQTVTVTVPKGEPVKPPPTQPPPTQPPPTRPPPPISPVEQPAGHGQRVAGLVIGAVGVVGIGAGTALGLAAKGNWSTATKGTNCDADLACTPAAVKKIDDARSLGNVATVVFAVGAVATAAGLVVYLTAPHHARATVSAIVLPGEGALVLGGSW